jgi:hypothetical protein
LKKPRVVVGSYVVGVLGLVVAIVSLVIAIRGDRLAHSIASEQRAVRLDIHPTVNQRDFTDEGLGLRVSAVNGSQRPVVISSASFGWDDCTVGEAIGWIPDLRVFDRHLIRPGAVTDERRELPVTIPSQSGTTFALLIDYWSPCATEEARSEDAWRKMRAKRAELQSAVCCDVYLKKDRPRFWLTVRRVPGGAVTVPVGVQPGMTPRFDWQTFTNMSGPKVLGISIRRKLGARGQYDILTLKVWGRYDGFARSVTRPIIAAEPTFFPVRELPAGTFYYAFRLGTETISAGKLVNPAPCKTPWGYTQKPCPPVQ